MTDAWTETDLCFMRAALSEAAAAAEQQEVPVGAVLVIGDEIVASGHNRNLSDHDPSAHAEIIVLREGAKKLGNHRIEGSTLYVTLEPCAMCAGAMLNARIERVVFGSYDQKAGAVGSVIDLSQERRFNHRFEVNGGLLADESAAILKSFFQARR